MEKIEKTKKTKTKQKRPNRHSSFKTEFFFPRLRADPLSFPQIWNPVPTNSEMFETAYCFTRIRVDSGGVERLQK